MFGVDFYPTPEKLLDKILKDIDWTYVAAVLEPSAGKGNIADYMQKACDNALRRSYYRRTLDVDCIELDPQLRSILKDKNHKVIHDNFLTFKTYKKYDLIVMNPPFSTGATHLLKALDLQKDGGAIICILNAETIRNPFSNERKTLVHALNEYNAEITYMEHEFSDAERKTDVEIAVVKVLIPEKENVSVIYENIRQKHYAEAQEQEQTDLILNDYIKAAIQQYNIELEAGISIIKEYKAMKPYLLRDIEESVYNSCILKLTIGEKDDTLSINEFVKRVRAKYWNALFYNPKFTKNMTSNLVQQYRSKVTELTHYDFSEYNIREIQLQMSKNLISGIEQCIIELFDELSHKHSWYTECEHNIHYYSGWKTNKAWIINKKVIIPLNAYNIWHTKPYEPNSYDVLNKLGDIEKALNYLDGGLTDSCDMREILTKARETMQTKKVQLKYFTVTFYKKGTCHIEFTNLELLKKLNIFGSQKKGWLPPGYGKMQYEDMDKESQDIVNEFDGKEAYKKVVTNSKYYLFDANNIPLLQVQ